MNLTTERVAHTSIPRSESYFASQIMPLNNVKGEYLSKPGFYFILLSYDGLIFHSQAGSKNGHKYATLAIIEGSPLAVGGTGPDTKKSEILDISSNTWTEVADYSYHD